MNLGVNLQHKQKSEIELIKILNITSPTFFNIPQFGLTSNWNRMYFLHIKQKRVERWHLTETNCGLSSARLIPPPNASQKTGLTSLFHKLILCHFHPQAQNWSDFVEKLLNLSLENLTLSGLFQRTLSGVWSMGKSKHCGMNTIIFKYLMFNSKMSCIFFSLFSSKTQPYLSIGLTFLSEYCTFWQHNQTWVKYTAGLFIFSETTTVSEPQW